MSQSENFVNYWSRSRCLTFCLRLRNHDNHYVAAFTVLCLKGTWCHTSIWCHFVYLVSSFSVPTFQNNPPSRYMVKQSCKQLLDESDDGTCAWLPTSPATSTDERIWDSNWSIWSRKYWTRVGVFVHTWRQLVLWSGVLPPIFVTDTRIQWVRL